MGSRGGISRERFFCYAFLASTCWYFFPGYIFQALSFFNWVCWIAPNNVVVNQLFGYNTGLVRFLYCDVAHDVSLTHASRACPSSPSIGHKSRTLVPLSRLRGGLRRTSPLASFSSSVSLSCQVPSGDETTMLTRSHRVHHSRALLHECLVQPVHAVRSRR